MKLSKQTVVKYEFVAIRFEMLFFTIQNWKTSDRFHFELESVREIRPSPLFKFFSGSASGLMVKERSNSQKAVQ